MSEEVQRGTEEGEGLVWGWSTYDDEGFRGAHPSKEHAIAEARDNLGSDFQYTNVYLQCGRYEDVTTLCPDMSNFTENLLESMADTGYEHCGELAEDWPGVGDEAQKELETSLKDVVEAWMKKHLKMPAWTPEGEPELVHKAEE